MHIVKSNNEFVYLGVIVNTLPFRATGYPARRFMAFSDINPDPLRADIRSKIFLLGPNRLTQVLEKHPDIKVAFILPSGIISYSPEIHKDIEILPK